VAVKRFGDAQAAAHKQTELTQTRIEIEVSGNRGEAQLAEAQRLARRDVVRAEGEAQSRELVGRGEASRVSQVGGAEAAVLLQKVQAYGEPRLYALNLVAEQLAHSAQPIVPERLLVMGGAAGGGSVIEKLAALLLAEKAGVDPAGPAVPQPPIEG
jgi:uncharacterized membrane protein YqiK